ADSAIISAVNLSEVLVKAVDRGVPLEASRRALEQLRLEVVPFDAEYAHLAASLRDATRSLGLSLGDRACLALGLRLGLTVLTADGNWPNLALGANSVATR